MKRKIFINIASTLLAITFLASCAGDDVATNKQGDNKDDVVDVIFEGATQATTSRTANALTRTMATHAIGAGAKVFWDAADKVWVKDNGGVFQPSSSITIHSSNKSYAAFGLTGSFTGTTHEVAYTGKNGTSGTDVEIKAQQVQSAPNNFEHLGESGDCGVATAIKAAYLCFLPRTSNPVLKTCKLLKIEVNSDQPLAGTYNLSAAGLSLVSGGTTKIELQTGSTGFPLSNASTSLATNGAYMVIAPGTHHLTVKYYVKDAVSGVTAAIEKKVSGTFNSGLFYDITANLQVRGYDEKYYMWDAKYDYWYDYELLQPTMNGQNNSSFPATATDKRWYKDNEAEATQSCKDCPNINELYWYARKGEPHADTEEPFTLLGHLWKGGVWFKKKSNITGFSDAHDPDGTDKRLSSSFPWDSYPVVKGRPSAVEDYFFLPLQDSIETDCSMMLEAEDFIKPRPDMHFCLVVVGI